MTCMRMGLVPVPMGTSSRTINGAAVGEPGTCDVFMVSCDGRVFDEENKLVFSALLNVLMRVVLFIQ